MGFLIRENASLAEIAWDCGAEWSDAGGEGSRFLELQERYLAWVRALSRVGWLECVLFARALMWLWIFDCVCFYQVVSRRRLTAGLKQSWLDEDQLDLTDVSGTKCSVWAEWVGRSNGGMRMERR